MIRLTYDPQVDALYLRISDNTIVETTEIEPGVMADRDATGHIVGIEILDASDHLQVLSEDKASEFLARFKPEAVET